MINKLTASDTIVEAINKTKPSRALWKGTVEIRKEGKTYLHPSLYERTDKGSASYKLRLASAVLKNKYRSTVNYILGQIFRKPLKLEYNDLSQDIQDFFEDFKEDVDNKNNDLNVFFKTSLKNGLIDGVSFCLVNTPDFENNGRTIVFKNRVYPNSLDIEKKLNLRPYWMNIELKDVLNVKVDWIDGKKEFSEFSYKDTIVQDKTSECITRVYEYTRETIKIYEISATGEETLITEKKNGYGFIPLSIFLCGEPESDYTAIPTLSDLAELNIAHYNAYSEHNSLMRYDRNPLWLAKEIQVINPDGSIKDITIGPGAGLVGSKESDLKSVGVDSQSVVQSMQDLADLEKAMDEYTSSLTTSQNMTAEQVDLISNSSDSQIKNWATNFKDFIEDLLYNTSLIKNFTKELGTEYPQIVVNDEFRKPFDYQKATLLQDMVAQGFLSNETYLETLKKMSVFDDDFDVSEELGRVGAVVSNEPNEPLK